MMKLLTTPPPPLLLLALLGGATLLPIAPSSAIEASSSSSRGGRRVPEILERAAREERQRQGAEEGRRPEEDPLLLLSGLAGSSGTSSLSPSSGGGGDGGAANVKDDVLSLEFRQTLDHFANNAGDDDDDDTAAATFGQRYFYTDRYVQQQQQQPHESSSSAKTKTNRTLAFLCVGGEGPSLTPRALVDSVHCTGDMIGLARVLFEEHGYDVHLFALEHRYYGESFPRPQKKAGGRLRGEGGANDGESSSSSFEVDYAHLSSRQAVRDIANFVASREASGHFDLLPNDDSAAGSKVRWVTFGGSYPGMLSAWSRLLHPEAIFASVSSSAPIQAELDFAEYNEHAGADLGDEEVGGSEACRAVVEEGHGQVADILRKVEDKKNDNANNEEEKESTLLGGGGSKESDGGELDRVAELFDVCGGADKLRESRRNREAFVGDGLIRIPAQGNDPSCRGRGDDVCDIEGLCDVIVTDRKSNPDKSSMEILADARKVQAGSCDNIDWESFLDWWKVPTKMNANDRSWLYQTCSEFGFYQTCNEDSRCPYGRGFHEIDQDLEICHAVFGIDPDAVRANIESTLTYYGGRALTPSTDAEEDGVGPNENGGGGVLGSGEDVTAGQKRIIFVTGDVDPWTELALTEGNVDHPSVSVEGASHHFWTHEVKDSDGEHIVAARRTIHETVSGWLGVEGEGDAGWEMGTAVAVETE